MPPRKAKKPEPELVASAGTMLQQQFWLHCAKRHPRMRFRSRQQHEHDHMHHQLTLNHIHEKPEPPQGMDPDTGRAPQDDWLN